MAIILVITMFYATLCKSNKKSVAAYFSVAKEYCNKAHFEGVEKQNSL